MKRTSIHTLIPLAATVLGASVAAARTASDRPTIQAQTPAYMLTDVKQPSVQRAKPAAAEPCLQDAAIVTPRPSKADSPRSVERETAHVPMTNVLVDDSNPTSVWARGDAYKANFTSAGFTYVPYLGARAPRNFPISFTLESAIAGGESIAFEPSVAPARLGNRIVYDRGALSEVYDLTTASVEQTFVFDTLPRDGEVTLRVHVASELARGDVAGRLTFQNELGRVEYSRAVAIDAAGERLELDTRFDGDDIQIRVPAEFVQHATFPLVVDPVVTTYSVSAVTAVDLVPDVAYSDISGRTAYVWERVFSATDHDIVFRMHDNTDASVFSDFIDNSSDNHTDPRIAYAAGANKFMVVSVVEVSGARTIHGRTVRAANGTMSADILISDTVLGDQVACDIGGDYRTGADSNFCVVWQRNLTTGDKDILFRVLDQDGLFVTGATFLDNGPEEDVHPAISKGTGDATTIHGWNVAFERTYSASNHDIRGATIQYDGVVLNPTFIVDVSGEDDRFPSVSSYMSNSNYFMVAYQRLAGTNTRDVIGRVYNGTSPVTTANLSALDGFDVTENQFAPSVDCDGTHFHVAYMESFNQSATDMDIKVSLYAMAGGALQATEVHENLASSSSTEQWPRLVAERSSGATSRCSRIAWADDASGAGDIEAGRFCSQVGGTVTSICFGDGTGAACPCGNSGAAGHGCASSVNANGGLLVAIGDARVSADTLVLNGSSMPMTATCLYFQGSLQVSGSAFGDGLRCANGTVIRLGSKTNAGGASSYPVGADPLISVRGLLPVGGGVRIYQAWYRNSAASFCTPSLFNVTNGARVTWVP